MASTTHAMLRHIIVRDGLTVEGIAGAIRARKPGLPRTDAERLVRELVAGGPARWIVAHAIIDLIVDSRCIATSH